MLRVVFALMFVPNISARGDECPAYQEIPSCDSIHSSKGYTYPVPKNLPADLRKDTCEHGWYFPNGTFIVDSTPGGNGRKLEIVVDVTPVNMTIKYCERNLQWQIECLRCVVNYTVLEYHTTHDLQPRNKTEQEDGPGDKKDVSVWFPGWVIALIVIVIVIGIVGISICLFCLSGKWTKYIPGTVKRGG